MIPQLTSYRTSKGISGSTESVPAPGSSFDCLLSSLEVPFPGVLDFGPPGRGMTEPEPRFSGSRSTPPWTAWGNLIFRRTEAIIGWNEGDESKDGPAPIQAFPTI